MTFPVHTLDSAPAAAKPFLEGAKGKYGFIPNLLAVMASEPPLLEAYMSLNAIFEKCTLSVSERQLVLLAVSQANGCKYCLAAHSAIAAMHQVDANKIAAARDGRPTGEAKLDALLTFTREVTITRGNPSAVATNRMAAAGYSSAQLLAVIVAVGMKTLSNYTNHIAGTPIDQAFLPSA